MNSWKQNDESKQEEAQPTPPMIDLTKPEKILGELFDDDRWVKDKFAHHLAGELIELSEALAACFRLLPRLNEAANKTSTKRTALVAAFAFGVLDDLLVSTKLLLAGKLLAAGNVMRQAIEGVAISILCSTDDLLVIGKKENRPVMARYWEKLEGGDKRTQGHLAINQLSWNAPVLRVSADAVQRLRQAKDHYNTFSHTGAFAIASRVSLEAVGVAYVGGHFDPAKLEAYHIEMRERLGLCRVLPPFMERLIATMVPSPQRGNVVVP